MLDLRQRDDRILTKILIHLGAAEPGENWIDEGFHNARNLPEVPGWVLTERWFLEADLPTRGILKTEYYSGEGKGKKGCKEDVVLRSALTELVLAEPSADYSATMVAAMGVDAASARRAYISSSLEDAGIDWNYDHHREPGLT